MRITNTLNLLPLAVVALLLAIAATPAQACPGGHSHRRSLQQQQQQQQPQTGTLSAEPADDLATRARMLLAAGPLGKKAPPPPPPVSEQLKMRQRKCGFEEGSEAERTAMNNLLAKRIARFSSNNARTAAVTPTIDVHFHVMTCEEPPQARPTLPSYSLLSLSRCLSSCAFESSDLWHACVPIAILATQTLVVDL